MDYIELNCNITYNSQAVVDIFIAELAMIDFESFEETDNGLNAYILKIKFNDKRLNDV